LKLRFVLAQRNGNEGKMENPRLQDKEPHHRWHRGICVCLYALGLIGCGTIKKAGIVATAAGTGAVAGSVVSGGVIAPIAGAMTSAFVADVVTEVTDTSPTTMGSGSCAPDNFWTLLGSMTEMGGWLLILIILIPMVLGWFLPGPLERKKKG